MIYVVQNNNYKEEYKVVYAGSSAHQALLEASQHHTCRVRVFKDGKRIEVTSTKGV